MSKNDGPAFVFRPNQLNALQVLASGGNAAEAAVAAGVAVRTVERWITGKEFKKALSTTQTEVLNSIASKLVALAKTSVESLSEILSDKETSRSIKVRVAVAALEAAVKWRQAVALEERVAAVEEVLQAKYGH